MAETERKEGDVVAWQYRIYFEERAHWSEWREGKHDNHLANQFEERALVPRSDYLAAVEREHRARQIIANCAAALPNGAGVSAELSSLEFMACLPKEMRLVCERLRSEASAAEAKVAEQAAEIAGLAEAISELNAKLPGAFWHIAKGRLSEDEALYAALILFGEQEIGHGEHVTSVAEAMRIATAAALSDIGSGK